MRTAACSNPSDRAPVLIFAVGNESRGDDALGPLLLRQLDASIAGSTRAPYFELIEDFQLQVEHALDIRERELVLFIDAGVQTPAPYCFYRLTAGHPPGPSSHALSPETLLSVCDRVLQQAIPPAFVLCVRGERFELGEPLTDVAAHHLSQTFHFASSLISDANPTSWERLCSVPAA